MVETISWRDYLELCKPKVVALMLLTALVGMMLAAPDSVPLKALVFGMLGIALGAGAAAVVNHLVDRRIDAIMARTRGRPIATGKISPRDALLFSGVLAISSMVILSVFVNTLTAVLTLLTLIGYAVVYTMYLKRATSQNIVIGGVAGAAPPLLGWVAVTGNIDPHSLLLVLIIYVWTPPHFWALAIHRYQDYARAKIPMLPVTHGIRFTKLSIVLYTLLLLVVSILPTLFGMSGVLYLVGALLLGFAFLYWSVRLFLTKDKMVAKKTFQFSIFYLMLLFCFLLLDHYLRV